MKKLLKSFAALIAVIAMVLSLTTAVNAATVTIPTEGILKDHTFTAYQIFTGRQEAGVLSDVKWGNGVNSTAFLNALKADKTYGDLFSDCDAAAAVAKVLSGQAKDSELAKAVAKIAYANKTGSGTELESGENELADGYYLVVDTTANVGEGGAYNTALLQVVGDINITVKTDAPTLEKKVQEDDKCDDVAYGKGYNDVADYNIGDAVPFKLIGSVPDMSRYDTYKYVFHDTLSAGLTLNENSIKVYVANTKDGTGKTVITGWTPSVNGQTFTVSFNDLKTVPGVSTGQYIIVEYKAELNSSAVIGLDGNDNTAYLEYSNKPDQSGSGDAGNTGRTPDDKVIVFTYELDTTKVDGEDQTKLAGSEFKLHDADNKWVIVDGNGKVTGWADTQEGGSTLTSGANGLFKVIGLDDGKYYLTETKAPAGYNLLTEDITVVITATTSNGQNWTSGIPGSALTTLDVTADGKSGAGDTNTGIASIKIENEKGSTLPETGGIGNYVFYGVGGVLMMGAAYYFVRKKSHKKI